MLHVISVDRTVVLKSNHMLRFPYYERGSKVGVENQHGKSTWALACKIDIDFDMEK